MEFRTCVLTIGRLRWTCLTLVTICGLLIFWISVDLFGTNRKETALSLMDVERSCSPVTAIFFLKTHKCGSSTVQNILLRYGDQRRLNFFLPTRGNYLGNRLPFHRSMVSHVPWRELNPTIFCHHTVFHRREVEAVMPQGTVYLSIVRDPVDLFESLYSYSRLDLHYKMDIEIFSKGYFNGSVYTDRASGYLGPNQMLYDLGFPKDMMGPRSAQTEKAVEDHVASLGQVFGLVMLAERFDESMVLMRDFLCWDTRDIVYFSHNVRTAEAKKKLTAEVRAALRELMWADEVLYNHFKEKFENLVRNYGEGKMDKEVRKLREMREELYEICVQKEGSGKELKGPFRMFSNQVQGFHLRTSKEHNSTCEALAMSEMSFTQHLREMQTARAFRISPVQAAAKWIQMYPNFPNIHSHRIVKLNGNVTLPRELTRTHLEAMYIP